MATRSRIGVELPDGRVKSVYCHWDGYPTGVGKDLLDRGFSSIDEVLGFINEGSRSTVETSYHAWRGEDIVTDFNSSVDNYFDRRDGEYLYLYTREEQWLVKPHTGRVADLKEVLS
jgi:hypothetical protein